MAGSVGHELLEVPDTPDRLALQNTGNVCFLEKKQEKKTFSSLEQDRIVGEKADIGGSSSDLEKDDGNQDSDRVLSMGFLCRKRRSSHRLINNLDSPSCLGNLSDKSQLRSTTENVVSQDQGYVPLESIDSSLPDSEGGPKCNVRRTRRLTRRSSTEICNRMTAGENDQPIQVGELCAAAQPEDKQKGKEIISTNPSAQSKQPRRKMLVRNGYISPKNIIADSNISGNVVKTIPEACNGVSGRAVDDDYVDMDSCIHGRRSRQHSSNNLPPGAQQVGKKKDKEISTGHIFEGGENSTVQPLHSRKRMRVDSMPSEEGHTDLLHGNNVIPRLAGEEMGRWQNTHEDRETITLGPIFEISRPPFCRRDQQETNLFKSCENLSERNTQLMNGFVGSSRFNEGENECSRINKNEYHEPYLSVVGPRGQASEATSSGSLPEVNSPSGQNHSGGSLQPSLKRRRMRNLSTQGHSGQTSSSNWDASPEVVYLRSSRPSRNNPSNTRITSNVVQTSISDLADGARQIPIEVDSLESPVNRGLPANESVNIDPSHAEADARARQIEADEMLARQLQEEFQSEIGGVEGLQQDDINLAWAFQRDENGRTAAASTATSTHPGLSLPMSFVTGGNRRREPARSMRNLSTRSSNRLGSAVAPSVRRRAPVLGRMGRFRRNIDEVPLVRPFDGRFQFPSYMNLDMRVDLLEAMERAVEGHSTHGHLAQVERDFNDNDHHRGASLQQINRLPVSTVQPTSISEEVCSVCLETPVAGEVIRHLLCMHRFHKECIDPWLSRQASCPVCKSSI
eukprot:Gb_05552 [translate_table: standard]